MLKGWETWLGLESAQDPKTIGYQCENMTELQQTNASKCEVNKPSIDRNGDDPLHHPLQAQGLRGYLMNFASSASKRISESISETAQSIKRTVEEGKIDIIDQTILGDFQKEQAKFVQEKKSKKIDAAVPPWVGYNEEETIQKQILALSADRRNFLREPPVGVQFDFDFDQMYPTALAMLEEDKLLNKMRFDLVPKHVKEDVFWRNYLYRVSLIKQSAQLTALAAQRRSAERREDRSLSSNTGPVESKSPPSVVDASAKHNEQEDVRRGMERLVLDEELLKNEELADWERELQQELQEYEVAVEEGSRDEQWDREMEELLQQD